MARGQRQSYLGQTLKGQLQLAVEKTLALHLFDIPKFDLGTIYDLTFEKLHTQMQVLDEVTPDLRTCMDVDVTRRVVLVFPFDVHGRGPMYGAHSDKLIVYEEYKSKMRDADSDNTYGLALNLILPDDKAVPISSMYDRMEWAYIQGPTDGILLTSNRLGEELYNSLVEPMWKLFGMTVALIYMREFGYVVNTHITTQGICKRVWPEAANFIRGQRGEAIERAKPAAWPKYFRENLKDLWRPRKWEGETDSDNPNSVTTSYLHAQLKALSDVVLAAQLMPDVKDHVDKSGIMLTSIQPVRVEPAARDIAM